MRILPLAFLGLAACSSHPETSACEEYLKGGLKSPSSYKQVKISSFDSRIPFDAWRNITRATGSKLDNDPRIVKVDRKYQADGGIRTVLIEYDADNSFGASIRGTEVCKFLMTSFMEEDFLGDPGTSAALASSSRTMEQLGLEKNEKSTGCCLSTREATALAGQPEELVH